MKTFVTVVVAAGIIGIGCNKTKNPDRVYNVNNATSVANWKGMAADHFNTGSFQVNGTMNTTSDGRIKNGNFVLPISSIKNFNLPDELKDQLLNHLKTADFFNMAVHPNAVFDLQKVVDYNGPEGVANANKMVTGNFTMIGKTLPVSFPAKVDYVGDSMKVHATLTIDRSKWGMVKYTDPAAPDYILPGADIELKIAAARKK